MGRTAPAAVSGADLVVAALDILAARGAQGRSEALWLVVRARPALRSLTVRGPGGGEVVAAGPPSSLGESGQAGEPGWILEVPIRSGDTWSGLLSAVGNQALTAEDAAILRGVADMLALVGDGLPAQSAARTLLDAEADLALVAAELEETVAESIVALRHTDPDNVRAAAAASLAEVRRIGRRLRAQALGDGLRAALSALRDPSVTVEAGDPALDVVPPAVAVLVERVAQAACTTAVGKVHLRATVTGLEVKLCVESADNEIDASEVERWRRRARALRGELRHWPGGVELTLPTAIGTEGRHDDGLDL